MKKKLLTRLLTALAFGLVILWPLYLLIGNLWLHQGGLERMLNRRPERLSIHWKSAWTVWPGVVHVRGFELRNQTRTYQWWVAVDQGAVDVDLWNLQDRELLLGPLTGSGARFHLRRRLDAPPRARPSHPDLYPPIPGLANPPTAKPEVLYPPRPRLGKDGKAAPKRDPWHVQISGLSLDDVREVWIEEVRFSGKARVTGSFDVRAGQRLEVEPSRIEISEGLLALGGGAKARPILADARGRVDGRIDPYSPREYRGWQVLQRTTGRATLEGQLQSLSFLDVFFRETRWVDLRFGGGGRTAADFRLHRGRVLPGSRFEAIPQGITVAFLDYRAQGDGTVRWSVDEANQEGEGKGEEAEGNFSIDLDHFKIQREGYGRPHVRGRGLRLAAASQEPRIGRLFQPTWVSIEMPDAEVPDLRFYNAYLPTRAGLALTGGTGRMSARFRADAPEWIGSGDLRLAAHGIGARFQEKRLRGNLEMQTLLRRADLRDKKFDISGSKIDLTDVVTLNGEPAPDGGPPSPWWARAHLDHAVLSPGAPIFLRARVESTLSDTRPLFSFVAPAGRGKVLRWVDNLLDIQGIGAMADLTVGRNLLSVDHLAVAGGKALVEGRFRMADGRQQGVLYAALGRFDVGVEMADGKRDWKILRPRKWFESYPAFE